ncbi:hypothetical protein, partial [Leuconostoc mesenteroides]|uniref:hypothetical protein n=1 Tax=Leuconostoc mesenteroides TaxID=1245 RepID=UPI002361A55F
MSWSFFRPAIKPFFLKNFLCCFSVHFSAILRLLLKEFVTIQFSMYNMLAFRLAMENSGIEPLTPCLQSR